MFSLLGNQYKHPKTSMGKRVNSNTWRHNAHNRFPYNSDVHENSIVQWNVWTHRFPREIVSTMLPALVGRIFSSVEIVLTFTLCKCNVMALLNNLSGTAARYDQDWAAMAQWYILSVSILTFSWWQFGMVQRPAPPHTPRCKHNGSEINWQLFWYREKH